MPLKQSRVSTTLVDVWPDRKNTIAFASPLPAVLGRLADIYRQPWYLRSVGSVTSRTVRSGRPFYLPFVISIVASVLVEHKAIGDPEVQANPAVAAPRARAG